MPAKAEIGVTVAKIHHDQEVVDSDPAKFVSPETLPFYFWYQRAQKRNK